MISWLYILLGILQSSNFPADARELLPVPVSLKKEILKTYETADYNLEEISQTEVVGYNRGTFFTISSGNYTLGYVYTGRVNSCRKSGCSSPSKTSGLDDSPEFFEYFILFDTSISVLRVVVYNYEATHGQEICAKGWLKQFTGYNGNEELSVGKNVDAISGATISVYGIVHDVQEKTQHLKRLVSL